ncbi:MAG: SPASM domain-containing protein [Sulfurimonas sp.]|uniref:radical SAM/SPASM domain-containing protein n=1 Tax=Sulfurimonas sp. TaxID=2022749 RepID=UPI00261F6611|nr:radical SAM/SPASM domain-containing protein [Sulfurimonas sp.]MDD5371895.1 SPASM domain-containing protein [Sulfurimonas sp.]
MQFHRAHIEVTNICGLACSFCPPKINSSKTMSLSFLEETLKQLRAYTKTLAFHVMGDPLTLSNLEEYLDLAQKYGFEAELTTSGYYLGKTKLQTLFHKAVRQLNISLNSYNKNSLNMTFDEYINSVLDVCLQKVKHYPKPFVNLRLWNLDDNCSEADYNEMLFEKLSAFFDTPIDAEEIYKDKIKSIRLAPKVILNFDSYFEWPSLNSTHESDGTCYGLKSHIGILANGTVVPCCLDGDGIIALGNLNNTPLKSILNSKRATDMIDGFKNSKAVEELCKKCSYKDRFSRTTPNQL